MGAFHIRKFVRGWVFHYPSDLPGYIIANIVPLLVIINVSVSLFQPPVDYSNLKVTQEHRIQAEGHLRGMCYFRGRLYIVERYRRLAVYSVTNQNTVTLLDTLDLNAAGHPRVDHQSGRVYIPCEGRGVCVVRYDGSKLVLVTTLRCVEVANALAIVSPDTLYVGDWQHCTVFLVDVTKDRVRDRLQIPQRIARHSLMYLAFLGDTVLLNFYRDGKLVLCTYRHSVPTPCKVLHSPDKLQYVSGLTTDHQSSFLATDGTTRTVYVLGVSGSLTHTIPVPGDREPWDCTVVEGQLWVGCNKGVIVMSSQ